MLPIILLANFGSVQSAFTPLVIVALLLDSAIVTVWYLVGVLLGNGTVKNSAITEFYQLGGTALLVVLVAGLLTSFSSMFFNILGSTQLMNPSTIYTMCEKLANPSAPYHANTQLAIIGPQGAYLAGGQNTNFLGLCSMVNPAQQQSLTTMIDYPLAATGVIIANLTNQTAHNLDSSFQFDTYLGFLENLTPSVNFCISNPPGVLPDLTVLPCIVPIPIPEVSPIYVGVTFNPDEGFDFIFRSMVALGSLLTNAFMLIFAQLTFIVMFLFAWPYLVFIGLVLRSNPFTRGIGGLLIATAIGMALFYPLAYSLEYLSLGHGLSHAGESVYGYNAITSIPGRSVVVCPGETSNPTCVSSNGGGQIIGATPACNNVIPYSPYCAGSDGSAIPNSKLLCSPAYSVTCPNTYAAPSCSTGSPYCGGSSLQTPLCDDGTTPSCVGASAQCTQVSATCNYTVNFFVEPDIKNAALRFGCWPSIAGGVVSLNVAEFADIAFLLIPFANIVGPLLGGAGVLGLPNFPLPATCDQNAAVKTLFALQQSYGIIGVTSYLLPLLNFFITISGILGLSGLLGGDTSLAGLSKLL